MGNGCVGVLWPRTTWAIPESSLPCLERLQYYMPGIFGNAKRGLRILDVICEVEIMPTRSGCCKAHR